MWNSIITWLCKDKLDDLKDKLDDLIENKKELDEARQEFFGDECYEDIPLRYLIGGLKKDSEYNTDLEYEVEELEGDVMELKGEIEGLEEQVAELKHLRFNSHYGK